MKWKKMGLICSHETLNLDWYKKNTMVPVPYLVDDKTLRIFLTMCDENNIGRIGYVDVNPDNPKEIIDYSRKPCLDIGRDGAFDDSGVLSSCIMKKDGKLYMFYSAYQKMVKIPYTILSGLACSEDNGKKFNRVSEAPILSRKNDELFVRSAVFCLKDEDKYKIWYSSGNSLTNNGRKDAPRYNIRYTESNDVFTLNQNSMVAIDFVDDEYGLTTPSIFKEDGIYKMFYSIRSISKGYRIGYAESNDGISWVRMDSKMEIDVSENDFDSEMMCFGNLLKYNNKTYLFYCGNHYGMGGFGYAVLEN